MFTDSHAHIYKQYYEDIEKIIKNAKINGINRIITNGIDEITNHEVLKLLEKYPELYGTLGIHPEKVNSYQKEDLDFIVNNITNPKIIAIGEIGLDYYYDKQSRLAQIKLFEQQLAIAEKYHLPVIIHSREATKDVLNCLKKYKVKGVIHSFSGTLEEAREFIKLGFYLGINGIITFKNSNLKEVFLSVPLDNILLETDSPYLTPHPFRGQKNEPKNIKIIAKFVANLKNISVADLAVITNKNLERLFKI